MMFRRISVVSAALVSCVATDREPTVHELLELAQRIWIEGAPERSAFAWEGMNPASNDRVEALRRALVAFLGTG